MAQRKDPIKTNYAVGDKTAFITFDPEKPEEAANAIKNANALDCYQALAYGGGRERFDGRYDQRARGNSYIPRNGGSGGDGEWSTGYRNRR